MIRSPREPTSGARGEDAELDATVSVSPDHGTPTVTAAPEALCQRVSVVGSISAGAVTPECAGRYTLRPDENGDAEVGRGGIGRILAVFDEHLAREVALKEIQPGVLLDAAGFGDTTEYAASKISRFLREARVTGQLIHPNIVPVYEVGSRADGSIYYTMRLVHGKTFKEALSQFDGLDARLELLSHFVDLCNAIAFAHSKGVIHRDIKPDNVMLGEFGETLVLDWGLAKVLAEPELDAPAAPSPTPAISADTGGDLTMDGSFMGTPSYVSPEQAAGRLADIDARTDIWSLGAMLYEILTGHPPFPGRTATEVLVRVLTDPVVPPRDLDPAVPSDLSSVCEKALRRDRNGRYSSARFLAEEVEAYRAGRRVMAHEYSAWEHLKRFAAQKKGLMAAVASILAVILAALVIVATSYSSERAARESAQAATAREQTARRRERLERLGASFHYAQGAGEKASRLSGERRPLMSALYAAASLAQNPANPMSAIHDPGFARDNPESGALLLESAGRYLQSSSDSFIAFERALGGDRSLNRAEPSPDGALVAEAARDGSVVLRGSADGAVVRVIAAHEGDVSAAVFSPDGRRLATCGADGTVASWDVATGLQLARVRLPVPALGVAWSPDGGLLASGAEDGIVRLHAASDLGTLAALAGHSGAVTSVAVSPDGALLASSGRDRTLRLWNVGRRAIIRILEGHRGVLSRVVFSPDSTMVASSSYDKTARVWSVATGETLLEADDHSDEVLSADFSADGRWLATACWDRAVRVFDVSTGALLVKLDAHDDAVLSARFTSDGERLLTTGKTGPVRIWTLRPPFPVMFTPGQEYLWSAIFSPDGSLVATGGQDGAVRVWNTRDGSLIRSMTGHEDYIQKVAFSPDGALVASGGYDRVVRVRRVADGTTAATLTGAGDTIRAVAFSPDGRLVAASSKDGAHRGWDPGTGGMLWERRERAGQARALAFSPDGQWLAMGGGDGVVRLARPDSGTVVHELEASKTDLTCLAFTPDGSAVAASTEGGEVIVWAVDSLREVKRLRCGAHDVYWLAFSLDGKLAATTSDDSGVVIWSMAEARPLLRYSMSQAAMTAAFSPDGTSILMPDSVVARIYPLDLSVLETDPERLIERAGRAAGARLDGFIAKQRNAGGDD
jgi:WD40 repeat protein